MGAWSFSGAWRPGFKGGAWVEPSLWQLRSQIEGTTGSLVRRPAEVGERGKRGRDIDGREAGMGWRRVQGGGQHA